MDANLRTMLDGIHDVALKVAPLMGAGAPAVAIAGSVVALIKVAEQTFGDEVGPALPAERERIESEIRQYVADTSDMLRGRPASG